MARIRKRFLFGVPLALLVLAIAGYFLWGAANRREVLRRIDALRATGEPVEWAAREWVEVPEEENALGPLLEAAALAERIREAARDRGDLVPRASLFTGRTPESRRSAQRAVDAFTEGFELIREAGERGRLVLIRPSGPLDLGDESVDVLVALNIAGLRCRLDPDYSKSLVDATLRLAVNVENARTELVELVLTTFALKALQIAVESGSGDLTGGRVEWSALLERVEGVAGMEKSHRDYRLLLLHCREGMRSGANRSSSLFVESPWKARWYFRPLFDRDTLRMLDGHEERVAESRREQWPIHAAKCRLARVALAVHAHAREAVEPLEALQDYEEWFGGPLPTDPIARQRFRYETSPDGATVWSPGKRAGASREELGEDGLLWEIPYSKSD